MQTFFFKHLGLNITLLLLYFSFFLPAAHAAPKKVLVAPILLHAEKDLGYLKTGIREMLTSRLAQEKGIELLSGEKEAKEDDASAAPLTEKSAADLGSTLQADYVVYGSVTILGESVSTDTFMVAVDSGKIVTRFSRAGKSRSEVIQHIDAFADQIKSELSGASATPPDDSAGSSSDQKLRRHPEKLPQPIRRLVSQKFKTEICGLAVGDVNGDGRQEIVFIDAHTVYIYRPTASGIEQLTEIAEKSYNNYISLDVADINQNGKAEIFVTNLPHNNDQLNSFVLEYDGKQYRRIADKQRLYFKAAPAENGAPRLMGQKRGSTQITSGDNELFEGKVFLLKWENGRYEPGDSFSLPRMANLFNFAKGDFQHVDKEVTLQYNEDKVLKLFNAEGKEEWSAEERSGSVATYLEIPDSQDMAFMRRYYLPTRIRPLDFNGDGKLDVMIVKNTESLSSVSRIKLFKNGRLACLSWDGLNFQTLWQSETVFKFISDFAVADLTGEGSKEVIYAVTAKEKGSFQKGQSYIVRELLPAL